MIPFPHNEERQRGYCKCLVIQMQSQKSGVNRLNSNPVWIILLSVGTERIQLIEELAANAWTPKVIQMVDGWRFRFNDGVSRRVNSVYPNENHGRVSVEEKMALAEAFYARKGLPPRYQICPASQPADLDEILAARGYTVDALTAVQVAEPSTVLARMEPSTPVEISILLSQAWFQAYQTFIGFDEHQAEMRWGALKRIGPRTGYALLRQEGKPVAVGLGVFERGWLGVFNMATQEAFRRQGCASAVLYALADWGRGIGASGVYLQVMEDNLPALALYRRAGFERLYHYHYREGRTQVQ